jgi:hypothetical protein
VTVDERALMILLAELAIEGQRVRMLIDLPLRRSIYENRIKLLEGLVDLVQNPPFPSANNTP